MKNNIYTYNYKVAEHYFSVCFNHLPFNLERMRDSYAPFESNHVLHDLAFNLNVLDDVKTDDITKCIFTEEQIKVEKGYHRVFTTKEGWIFEQTQPNSDHTNGRVRVDRDMKHAEMAVRGNELQRWSAFNSAVMLCYMLATARHNTILAHSSCVVNDGNAYLFLGKSGTGKSTHSSLWLKHIEGTILLNDDHPILRINNQGEVIAYGSPWSGKTPCYKNISAPIGGIVRINRALQNSIVQLNAIQAYASLTTSFSGMTWETEMADGRHATIEKVIENIPCYTLNCLPDRGAAHVCYSALTNHTNEM